MILLCDVDLCSPTFMPEENCDHVKRQGVSFVSKSECLALGLSSICKHQNNLCSIPWMA